MATREEIISDPDFQGLAPEEKQKVLQAIGGLPAASGEGFSASLNKFAKMPGEALGQIPVVGGALQAVTPSTPAGWGGMAAGLAAAPFTAGMSIPATAAITGGAAALGGTAGALAGGQDLGDAATTGAVEGAGQALGSGFTGFIGKQIAGRLSPIISKFGDELMRVIPGVRTNKPTPSWLHQIVQGGEGQAALSRAYEQGADAIENAAGSNAFIQSPIVDDVLRRFRKLLPSASNIALPAGTRGQPAHLALQYQPVGVRDAITLAQELGEAASKMAKNDPVRARVLQNANQDLRSEIAQELENYGQGLGDAYRRINTEYGRGITALNVLKKSADDIFVQSSGSQPKIDEAALARAFNDAGAAMRKWQLGEVAAATRRGGAPGTGATQLRLPAISSYLGTQGLGHARFHRGLSMTNYPGLPVPGTQAGGGLAGQELFGNLINGEY